MKLEKKGSDPAKLFCILKDGHSDGGGGEGNVLAIHLHQAGEPARVKEEMGRRVPALHQGQGVLASDSQGRRRSVQVSYRGGQFFFAKEHVEFFSTLGLGGREMWEFSQLYVISRGQVKASCCGISYEEVGAGVAGIAVLPLYAE